MEKYLFPKAKRFAYGDSYRKNGVQKECFIEELLLGRVLRDVDVGTYWFKGSIKLSVVD